MQKNTIIVQAVRTKCTSGEELLTEIIIDRVYHEGLKSWWIQIVRGGVTGYESMKEDHVKDMTEGWHACAGTKGVWDKLFLPGNEMMKVAKWIEEQKLVEIQNPKYLFMWFNGIYEPFNSIEEYDAFRRKYPNKTGVLYTYDGHIVDVERAREIEERA